MIEVITRQEFEFAGDAIPGHIVFLDGDPVLQLHLYEEYYTLFWRGRTSISELLENLQTLLAEFRHATGRGPDRLSFVVAEYVNDDGCHSMPFSFFPRGEEESALNSRHRGFLAEYADSLSFARFDVEADVPIILWADLSGGEEAEIGFSSRRLLPSSVLGLFRATCEAPVGRHDLERIGEKLRGLISHQGQNHSFA